MAREVVLVIYGLTLGAITALVVLGLVVTYRVTRTLNLAHGAMGMLVTFMYWQLTVEWHWPVGFAAAACLLVLAPLLGVVVGGLLFRPLAHRDDSARLAGSIALIVTLTELVSRVWGTVPGRVPSLLPGGAFRIGRDYVGVDQPLTIAVAVLVTVGAHLALERTSLGLRLRAVADDRSLAPAFAIDVRRVELAGWVLATVLAGAAGILISGGTTLNSITLTFLVVSGLAAAAFGRMVSLGGALAGAAVIGLVQAELSRLPADVVRVLPSIPSGAPFVLLVGALGWFVARGAPVGAAGEDTHRERSDVAARPLLSLGGEMARRVRRLPALGPTVGAALAAAGLWAVGAVLDAHWLFVVTTAAIWLLVFASMSLLNGYGRQVSLCQASFMGIGALVAARVQTSCVTDAGAGRTTCEAVSSGAVHVLGIVAAVAAAGVAGLIVAAAATRVRGVMLAVATLSFGFFLDNTLFPSRDLAGGVFGLPLVRPPGFRSDHMFWMLCGTMALGAAFAVRNLSASGTGRVLRALEESPDAVAAFGLRGDAYKLAMFTVAAAMAGLGGYLYGAQLLSFYGGTYSVLVSLLLFVVIHMVGSRHRWSAVVAAALFVLVPELLASFVGDAAPAANLLFGVAGLVTLGLPDGLLGWVAGHARPRSHVGPPGPRRRSPHRSGAPRRRHPDPVDDRVRPERRPVATPTRPEGQGDHQRQPSVDPAEANGLQGRPGGGAEGVPPGGGRGRRPR